MNDNSRGLGRACVESERINSLPEGASVTGTGEVKTVGRRKVVSCDLSSSALAHEEAEWFQKERENQSRLRKARQTVFAWGLTASDRHFVPLVMQVNDALCKHGIRFYLPLMAAGTLRVEHFQQADKYLADVNEKLKSILIKQKEGHHLDSLDQRMYIAAAIAGLPPCGEVGTKIFGGEEQR